MRKKICRCGKVIFDGEICSCKKVKAEKTEEQKEKRREYEKKYRDENKEVVKPISTAKWQRKREYILHRDAYYCQRCFHKFDIITMENLQVHHIKPRIKYPHLIYVDSNLITLCRTCNLHIGTAEELDFDWIAPENDETL